MFRRLALPRWVLRKIFLVRPERLWRRYLIALSAIVGFAVLAEWISATILVRSEIQAETINRMGQQRMLSQRILLLGPGISPLALPGDAQKLQIAVTRFRDNHLFITENAIVTDDLRTLYFEGDDGGLDARSRTFLATVDTMIAAAPTVAQDIHTNLITQSRDALLLSLDEAVQLYEQFANDTVSNLATTRLFALLVAAAILLLEVALIFLPGHVVIKRAFAKLSGQARRLRRANTAIADQFYELETAQRELQFAANNDALTGLSNRRALNAYLEEALSPAGNGASQSRIGVVQVDLDEFKPINDTYGHEAGDRVLVNVAKALREEVRSTDMVARMGGDEFIIVSQIAHPRGVIEQIGDRIIRRLNTISRWSPGSHNVGVSLGYATGKPGVDTPHEVLARADQALYAAKRSGRNMLLTFDDVCVNKA